MVIHVEVRYHHKKETWNQGTVVVWQELTGRGRPLVLYNDQCDISVKLDIVTGNGIETGNKSLTMVDKIQQQKG